ncbi:MAG: cytochrome c oxidase subunit 3 [Gemmatimonadetes bacterium]|nr:cytochrome c oxidase subunit 3 [Gemmatimonadota bacterium]
MSVVTEPGTGTELLQPEVREREWVRVPGSGNERTVNNGRNTGNGGGDGEGGGGDGPTGSPSIEPTGIGADVLGMLVFIASEAVLFLTLTVTFALARASYPEWPPADQPRLPLTVSVINTLVLLGSGAAMAGALRFIRRGRLRSSGRMLTAATLLGILFLVVQGVEWVRLIEFGLTVTENLYGAVFYVLIGTHALHAFIAVLGLLCLVRRFSRGAYTLEDHDGLVMGGMFWGFVVLVWPGIFVFVYLL